MRRRASYMRVAVVLAAGFAIAAVAAPTAASDTDPIVPVRFAADSGDRCRYGSTEGVLSWRGVHTALPSGVDVSGTLTDKPAVASDVACRDDRYFSVATFVAFAGRTAVDRHAERADNGVVKFRFSLGVDTRGRVDRLEIQVCRNPLFGTAPSYCGKAQTYPAPTSP